MASQHGPRFVSPIYNQNFPSNNFNVNPSMDRPPRPQFQMPPNPSSGSLQLPETSGFQNRPQFSNFPGGCGFLNRPPPPLPACNPFSGPSNSPSYQPFPGAPNSVSRPQFPSQAPASAHPALPHHSPAHPPLSHHSPAHPPLSHHSPAHPPLSHHSPAHPPLSHHSPDTFHPPPRLSQPTFSPQRPFPPHQPPQHNRLSNMSVPPQHNQLSNMPVPPQHNQLLNISIPSQHNQLPNMSGPSHHNQPPNMSASPEHLGMSHPPQQNQFRPRSYSHQHQGFRSNSPARGPKFDNSFQRPYRPWNQMSRFSGPKTPFSSQSPNIVKYHQLKNSSQQVNKKKKEKSREFRKLKDDSTEKPYSCDTCDRAFVTENELRDHLSQHIQCDYENCTFEAHPKIVLLHKKMQHETGYAERISKLKDDAEVKKWREERRKRFPTAENIRKRQAEQAERIARGEVLETKEFGKFNANRKREENGDLAHGHGKRMRGHRNQRNRFRRNFREHHSGFQQFKVDSESDSDSDSHISLNMFSGLSSLANSAEKMCHSDEAIEISSSEQNLSKSISNNVENHLNVSHSENNKNDRKTDSPRGNARPANESVLEIPEDEIEKPHKDLIVLEDSDDEGPEIVEITKCREEIFTDKNSDEGPDVMAINNSLEKICDDANSDDEGPEVMAINKSQEKICNDKKKEQTGPDNNAAKRASKRKNGEASKGEKKIRCDVNDAQKASEMIPEDVNREEEQTGPNMIAATKTTKRKHEEVSNGEKKIRCDINDARKASEMNPEDVNRGNQSRRHGSRRENNFSAEQYASNQIRRTSLLEKLLADDIRHERNVIFQCIRHIVNNNFFGLAVKKS